MRLWQLTSTKSEQKKLSDWKDWRKHVYYRASVGQEDAPIGIIFDLVFDDADDNNVDEERNRGYSDGKDAEHEGNCGGDALWVIWLDTEKEK